MSRNASGTYTLPSGNPVVTGTLIESSWANTTLSDLASAMTDSLSRSAQGGMTAALRLYDGTSSVPGLAWGSETTTGWYRSGAGDMRLVVTGSEVVKYLSTGVAVTGTLSATGAVSLSGTTMTLENSTAYYPQVINRNKTADANGSYISLQKIRGSSIVQNGDVLGNVIFSGYDGASYLQGAYINAVVSATPGTNDMPADLAFGTTADGGSGPTERLRITQAGNVGVGTSSPNLSSSSTALTVNTGTAANYSAIELASGGTLNYHINANNSAVYHVAAGTRPWIVYTNSSERMRIDSSGNVGIGTTSTTGNRFYAYTNSGHAGTFYANGGGSTTGLNSYGITLTGNMSNGGAECNIVYGSAGAGLAFNSWSGTTLTERMRVDSSGNVGIGTSSPGAKLEVASGRAKFVGNSDQYNIEVKYNAATNGGWIGSPAGDTLAFYRGAGGAESGRFDTSGNLLVGTTSGGSKITSYQGSVANNIESSSPSSGMTHFLVSTSLGTGGGSDAMGVYDAGGISARITTNGYFQSRPNSYGSTSDERLKENIVDATPKLADLMQIRVRNFNYKDQPGDKQLGVIAQELETVFPGLVHEIPNSNPELSDADTVKSVKYSVFVPMLIKAMQEQQAIITALTARVTALETN